jgi:hypothetical protein
MSKNVIEAGTTILKNRCRSHLKIKILGWLLVIYVLSLIITFYNPVTI